MGKPCPLLCARSSGSHVWMSEGRLYHPCENQHLVLLEILKSLCSTSVGIMGIILSIWHMDCSGQWDTPAAGGEQAALSKGTTNHPALSMGMGRMCCSRGACSVLNPWEWCCSLPTYGSRAAEPVLPWVQQGHGSSWAPVPRLCCFVLWDRFKNHPTNHDEPLCPMQKPAGSEALSPGQWQILWQQLSTGWPRLVPAAPVLLSLQPNFCTCQTLLSLGALMQSAAIWLE